jgi:hypothetical protein
MEYWNLYEAEQQCLLERAVIQLVDSTIGREDKWRIRAAKRAETMRRNEEAQRQAQAVEVKRRRQAQAAQALRKSQMSKPPSHPKDCICEWCAAVIRARTLDERKVLAGAGKW